MEGEDRESVVKEARRLGEKYLDMYGGCAQATFLAVAEATGMYPNEETFKAFVGLSGGVGELGIGTCGAVTGASAAISLSLDIGRDELERDTEKRWVVFRKVDEFVEKFRKKYPNILCRGVQMELYGMSFDLLDEEVRSKFEEISRCEEPVADAAGLAAEVVLDSRKGD